MDALAVHSNNPVVDAILNQKYAQACELGIQVDFAINDLAEFPLSNKETVVVLSNLLDNAIEACKTQKGTRLIRVKIQCSEEKTILSVMNTIDKAPVMENGLPVTTKADPLAHGYGLQNIVSILADHGRLSGHSVPGRLVPVLHGTVSSDYFACAGARSNYTKIPLIFLRMSFRDIF